MPTKEQQKELDVLGYNLLDSARVLSKKLHIKMSEALQLLQLRENVILNQQLLSMHAHLEVLAPLKLEKPDNCS